MLIYLMFLHFVADFILQSREMGQKKSSEFPWLMQHLAIQGSVFMLGLFLFLGIVVAGKLVLCNTLVHGIIDWYIWKGYKISVYMRDKTATPTTWKYWEDHLFYTTIGFDQLLHVSTLIGLWMWLCQ